MQKGIGIAVEAKKRQQSVFKLEIVYDNEKA